MAMTPHFWPAELLLTSSFTTNRKHLLQLHCHSKIGIYKVKTSLSWPLLRCFGASLLPDGRDGRRRRRGAESV